MFERYTESARRTLFFARYEASQFGSIAIESEHLLLGVAREAAGPIGRLLASAHCSHDALRTEVAARVAARPKVSGHVEIPFSAETKRILRYSVEEADRLDHHVIAVDHLLLAVLLEEQSLAATLLAEHGVRLDDARKVATETSDVSITHQLWGQVSHLAHLAEHLRAAAPEGETRALVDRVIADLKTLQSHISRPE